MAAAYVLIFIVCGFVADVDTQFVQVHPNRDDVQAGLDAEPKSRAVVLIHGLTPHPFSSDKAKHARMHDWQLPDSTLVRALAKDSDVFSFAYGQDVPVTEIAGSGGLRAGIIQLRETGYREVVLIGHSAGGLIARQFVEDSIDSGVTKVIQICSPNLGSSLAYQNRVVRKTQEAFVKSLSKADRAEFLKTRAGLKIPGHVEFICVVGDGGGLGDFVVSDDSQWPVELQSQCIPAIHVNTTHPTAVRSPKVAEILATLVREPQPRCDTEKIAELQKAILGNSRPVTVRP